MKFAGRALVLMLALGAVAACGEDQEIVDPLGPGEYLFEYIPSANTPDISSIVVRGSFNNWGGDGDLVMVEQADGSWEVVGGPFDPATYQYKYVFNGDQWAGNMCDDATWGNPNFGNKVDPNVVSCVDDGFGGMNAELVID